MDSTVIIAIITGVCTLSSTILSKLIDSKSGMRKDVTDIKDDIGVLKENDRKNGDMIYQMLDHLATNNNTGGMKKALDDYNSYFRHS
ncbi:MAG: hypothetical protein IJI77_01480 [Erysipelotrichaceae bacterium]|nr:hypothetical protein [Erysipelotrichaceae bacterium]